MCAMFGSLTRDNTLRLVMFAGPSQCETAVQWQHGTAVSNTQKCAARRARMAGAPCNTSTHAHAGNTRTYKCTQCCTITNSHHRVTAPPDRFCTSWSISASMFSGFITSALNCSRAVAGQGQGLDQIRSDQIRSSWMCEQLSIHRSTAGQRKWHRDNQVAHASSCKSSNRPTVQHTCPPCTPKPLNKCSYISSKT